MNCIQNLIARLRTKWRIVAEGICCKDCWWFRFHGDHPAAGQCLYWRHRGPRDGYRRACSDYKDRQ